MASNSDLEARIAALEAELAQERRNRADDRTGRTRAEAQLRALALQALPSGVAKLQPIGFINSVFRDRRGTPRQGCLAPSALARLELAPSVQARDSLLGLDAFSHVWLIFSFHQNTNTAGLVKQIQQMTEEASSAAAPPPSSTLPAWCAAEAPAHFPHIKFKIAAPRLAGEKVGVFATRSPHRPNPIGLSLVSIVSIHADASPPYLLLSGADLVDGTPILDLKPYVPHYDTAPIHTVRLPPWINEQSASFAHVWFTEACAGQLRALPLGMFPTLQSLVAASLQILRNDIRSTHQQRLTSATGSKTIQSSSSASSSAASSSSSSASLEPLPAQISAIAMSHEPPSNHLKRKAALSSTQAERNIKWASSVAVSEISSALPASELHSEGDDAFPAAILWSPTDAIDGTLTRYELRLDSVVLHYVVVGDAVVVLEAAAADGD